MPSVQRGQTYKLASRDQETGRPLWAYRFRDENGRRRQVGGFRSKTEAGQALASALDRARLGPEGAARRDWTVAELVDHYLAQHQVEAWTLVVLTWKLEKVKAGFGEVPSGNCSPRRLARGGCGFPRGTASRRRKR